MKRRTMLAVLACLAAAPAFALYDPKPDEVLAAVQGEWRGSLVYRDYSEPDRMVTLPTQLLVALSAPNELVLHYVFDDGPSKTVYSYERMGFNFKAREVTWSSGKDAKESMAVITADSTSNETRVLVFERKGEEGGTKRFTMELSARSLKLAEDEVAPSGVASFRNRYVFVRPGA